jgi:hypothetical protein
MGEEVDAYGYTRRPLGPRFVVSEMQRKAEQVRILYMIFTCVTQFNVKRAQPLIHVYCLYSSAGALHGARFGLSPTTFTVSQGLLLIFRIFTRLPANFSPRSFTLLEGWQVRRSHLWRP